MTSLVLVAAAPAVAHVERQPVFVDLTQRPLSDPAKRVKSFRSCVRKAWRGGITTSERKALLAAQQRASAKLVSKLSPNAAKEAKLVACLLGERSPDARTCDRYRVPPKPGPQ